jgi:peptidyl-prolyl cis-trans isomerase A (cyclophilin A)
MKKRLLALTLGGAAIVWSSSCASLSFQCRAEGVDAGIATPDSFLVHFESSRGPFDVMAHRDWAPIGVQRLYQTLGEHYYDDARFFRVVKNYVAQFGLAGDPSKTAAWRRRCMADEAVKHPNTRGTMAYARGGPNTRSIQLFINFKDNPKLDTLAGFGFPPIGELVQGMENVDSLYNGYGDSAPRSGPQFGREGPSQDSITAQGNAYLNRGWPKLDYVKTARIIREWKR